MKPHPSAPAPWGRSAGILGAGLLTATVLAALAPTPARAADGKPEMSPGVQPAPHSRSVFAPDPKYSVRDYDPKQQVEIYGGKKKIVDAPRPLVELGEPLYKEGPLQPNYDIIGRKNLVSPAFSVYGDFRAAVAYNDNGQNKKIGQVATRLNLDVDLSFTATERVHALFRPLDKGGKFTRSEFFGPNARESEIILDAYPRTFFFEGDIGNIMAGLTDRYQSFDLPFTVGLVPLIFQNGVWFNSAITGGAFSIIGRNSARANIANFDLTFFGGFDKVTLRQVYGAAAFIEANEGYWEAGIGGVNDERKFANSSFESVTVAFTKRYGGWLSNSVRLVGTIGNSPLATQKRTEDGFIVLMENSLISHKPLVLVPYLNLWAGFGRPQSLLRNADAGGILNNTGILFQTDGLTGFPKMDDTGQDTYGAAIGVNYLFDLDQQIVLEAATVQVIDGPLQPGRAAKAEQYGVGARYQKNLSKALIFRADVMYAERRRDDDIAGIRTELRLKF